MLPAVPLHSNNNFLPAAVSAMQRHVAAVVDSCGSLLPLPQPLCSPRRACQSYVCAFSTAGLVLEPLPVGAWAMLAVTTAVATKTLTFAQVGAGSRLLAVGSSSVCRRLAMGGAAALCWRSSGRCDLPPWMPAVDVHLLQHLPLSQAFSAFTNDVIWLIVVSFFFARVSREQACALHCPAALRQHACSGGRLQKAHAVARPAATQLLQWLGHIC